MKETQDYSIVVQFTGDHRNLSTWGYAWMLFVCDEFGSTDDEAICAGEEYSEAEACYMALCAYRVYCDIVAALQKIEG